MLQPVVLYYDLKTKPRKFKVREKVLLLLPTKANKLETQWQAPFVIEECKGNGVRLHYQGKS